MAVPATLRAERLLELGAQDVLVVAASRGVGALRELPADRLIVLDSKAKGFMAAIRAAEGLLANLPDEVVARVDAFDPERRAKACRAHFSQGLPVAGRPSWGARPAAWQALEDKTIIDSLWDAAGVARVPCEVVAVEDAPAAAARIDEGAGTVWAGDSKEGFNGGASYTRWIRNESARDEALEFFGAHCDRVRVMPFLAGVPCSIHGIVVPGDDHVITLRPMEMVVLHQDDAFVYCGAACAWRPEDAVRDEMREVARRVGRHLREAHGYRGAFTVDGVVGAEGFRPTELNPRFGAAMHYFNSPDLPLEMLVNRMIEGDALDYRAEALEAELLRRSEEPRSCGHGVTVESAAEDRELALVCQDPGWRLADEGEDPHATVIMGPWGEGGFLRVFFPAAHVPMGPAVAPRLAQVLRFVDGLWSVGLGGVTAAD